MKVVAPRSSYAARVTRECFGRYESMVTADTPNIIGKGSPSGNSDSGPIRGGYEEGKIAWK